MDGAPDSVGWQMLPFREGHAAAAGNGRRRNSFSGHSIFPKKTSHNGFPPLADSPSAMTYHEAPFLGHLRGQAVIQV